MNLDFFVNEYSISNNLLDFSIAQILEYNSNQIVKYYKLNTNL